MVTWNVATAEPPDDVTSLLQLDVQPPTDLYVIGWETDVKSRLGKFDVDSMWKWKERFQWNDHRGACKGMETKLGAEVKPDVIETENIKLIWD